MEKIKIRIINNVVDMILKKVKIDKKISENLCLYGIEYKKTLDFVFNNFKSFKLKFFIKFNLFLISLINIKT